MSNDYNATCQVLDEEDFGTNFYRGTIVIDGVTCEWEQWQEAESIRDGQLIIRRPQPEGGKLTFKQRRVTLYQRRDGKAIHEAISEACCTLRELEHALFAQPEAEQAQQATPQVYGVISDEDGGLSMEDILGPPHNGGQSQ